MLKKPIRRKRARMFCLDHVESDGRLLFEEVVKMDLEGMDRKRKDSLYKVTEKPSLYWIKVKNSHYTTNWRGARNCLSANQVLNL